MSTFAPDIGSIAAFLASLLYFPAVRKAAVFLRTSVSPPKTPEERCFCPLLPISVNFDRHVSSVARRVHAINDFNRSDLQHANEKRCAFCP
jgi:hypothetical protein